MPNPTTRLFGAIAKLVANTHASGYHVTLWDEGTGGYVPIQGEPATTYTALDRTGWTAMASDTDTYADPQWALDGDPSTRWTTGEAETPGMWYQVDMGSPQVFRRIVMDTSGSPGDVPYAFNVTLSDDGTTWGIPVALGHGQTITVVDTDWQVTRFIRITLQPEPWWITGGWWSIHEFNVYR